MSCRSIARVKLCNADRDGLVVGGLSLSDQEVLLGSFVAHRNEKSSYVF